MNCEELKAGYDAFALGMEEQPEGGEIREHLQRDCSNCVPGIRHSMNLVSRMSGLAKIVNPPKRLRKRIIAAVNPGMIETQGRSLSAWSAVWAAMTIIFLTVAVLLGVQAHRLGDLRFQETARVQRAMSLLAAPDSEEVSFGTNRNRPPRGRIVVNRRRRGVALLAANLPPVEEGKAFQLWLIPLGGKPVSAGVFHATPNGTAVVSRAMDIPGDLGTVAVTVEDEAGVAAPTSTPIIAAETR